MIQLNLISDRFGNLRKAFCSFNRNDFHLDEKTIDHL